MSWATKKEFSLLKSLLKRIKIYDKNGNDRSEKLILRVTDSKGNILIDKSFNNGTIHEMIDYYISSED